MGSKLWWPVAWPGALNRLDDPIIKWKTVTGVQISSAGDKKGPLLLYLLTCTKEPEVLGLSTLKDSLYPLLCRDHL